MAQLLVAAVAAIEDLGRTVLGDVTLEAIAVRVVARAQIAHPCLHVFRGRSLEAIDRQVELATSASAEEIQVATRTLLADHLRVLSHLTAGAMTPRLYEKLNAVGVKARVTKRRST